MRRSVKRGCLGTVAVLILLLFAGFLMLLYQGRRRPVGDPQYVALGSSFAAGIGLGPRAPGSPVACMRSLNGYPHQLARQLRLSLVDMSCSAATTQHVLHGGQYFQGSQLDGLGPDTQLVTVTSGGNDVRYVGDLAFIAGSNSASTSGWILRHLWSGPARPEQRNFRRLQRDLVATVGEIRRRSPHARIVLATYPLILPPAGTCARLNLRAEQVATMRAVGERLAETTRAAAQQSGAMLVDMQRLGAGHDACSQTPWTNGWVDARGTQFHPTLLGAQATAAAIAAAFRAPS